MDDRITIRLLHADLDRDLKRIAKRFKNPKITLIIRNPDVADGDVILTDDEDLEKAIGALRNLADKQSVRA